MTGVQLGATDDGQNDHERARLSELASGFAAEAREFRELPDGYELSLPWSDQRAARVVEFRGLLHRAYPSSRAGHRLELARDLVWLQIQGEPAFSQSIGGPLEAVLQGAPITTQGSAR